MLANLGILALFLAYVSALGIWTQNMGHQGESVTVKFNVSKDDPSKIDLYLFNLHFPLKYPAAHDVDIKKDTEHLVMIPSDVESGKYQFVATKVHDESVEYAHSNNITIIKL